MRKGPPANNGCDSIAHGKLEVVKRRLASSYVCVAKSLIDFAVEWVKVTGALDLAGIHLGLKGELVVHAVHLAPKLRRLVAGRVRSTEAAVRPEVGEEWSDVAAESGESAVVGEELSPSPHCAAEGELRSLRIVAVVVECESQGDGRR